MDFKTKFNEYFKKINCTATELSEASNVAKSVISLYRHGDRTPRKKSETLNKLIIGFSNLSKDKEINEEKIRNDFMSIYENEEIIFKNFIDNLNNLINDLNINVSDMARKIGFDSSYISKIRAGIRKPQNIPAFINITNNYIKTNYNIKK